MGEDAHPKERRAAAKANRVWVEGVVRKGRGDKEK